MRRKARETSIYKEIAFSDIHVALKLQKAARIY